MVKCVRLAARPADEAPLPSVPTDAKPGTSEKVDAMAARANLGEQLFHPGDAGWVDREEMQEMASWLRLFKTLGS